MSLKSLIIIALLPLSVAQMRAEDEKVNYMPSVHGAIRSRFESNLDEDESRFQVRNARLTVDGQLAPAISYYVQIDACNQGKMQFLDAWGRLTPSKSFLMQAGQFTMPFGVEPIYSPATYIFNNRAFIGKQVFNYRGTGVKFAYTIPKNWLTLEAGAFNSAYMDDHTVWSKHLSYTVKGIVNVSNTTFTTGYATIAPYGARMNYFDFAVGWKHDRWLVQTEYMNKHYCNNNTLDGTHAWLAYADYHFPVKWGMFNQASAQVRYDGMTNNSDGRLDDKDELTYNDAAANRITLGATVSSVYKKVHADVRLNYEKYFYHKHTEYKKVYDNLISAELVIRF